MNDNILGIQDKKSARAVRNIFNGLGLPVPEDGEYRKRSFGSGPLVFVSQYGFVARIVPKGLIMTINTPCFIKPLFNRAAGNHRFIIDPGYDLREIRVEHCSALYRKMREYGISWYDNCTVNIARVPNYPSHLVAIDIDCIQIDRLSIGFLTQKTRAIAKLLGIVKETDPQVELYKPLRDILEQAWPKGAPAPDPEGIRAFKELCLDFKADGLLRSDWEDPQYDYKGTYRVARAYDAHLRAYDAGREIVRPKKGVEGPSVWI